MKNLLVLESPNKVKKVQSYVGNDYLVSSSKGHIRSLGTNKILGINIENNFEPKYYIDTNKRNIVNLLKEQLKKCSDILYIATDFDREGEAIGWHITQVLNVQPTNVKRLVFKEITKKGLQNALTNPINIDMNMVYSQQARMILDKLIGYKISPVLWKQFNNYKLSAGRVQSVVVKLINEREKEINSYQSNNYFKINVSFSLNKDKMKSSLNTECETKLEDIDEIKNIITNTKNNLTQYNINELKINNTKRKPPPPFITSSLQQEASNKLGMSPDICMKTAQKLYEHGLITYMRTDSLILSEDALKDIKNVIKHKYGEKYYKLTKYNKKSKGAQEAHEACRPTDFKKETLIGIEGITLKENKLYQLIWKRTIACQMCPADVEIKTIKVELNSKNCNPKLNETKYNNNKNYTFVGKFEKILFDGYLIIYNNYNKNNDGDDDGDDDGDNGDNNDGSDGNIDKLFSKLKKGQELWVINIDALEKISKCPQSRYTEASLIKQLEDLGIGRPSTYASMVTKVQTRGYVEKRSIQAKKKEFKHILFNYPNDIKEDIIVQSVGGEKNKMFPTSIGIMVTNFLVKDFDKLMDYGFTALIEGNLDEIANGKIKWYNVINNVWLYLYPIIDKLLITINKTKETSGSTSNKQLLGVNPNTDNNIYIISTKFGLSAMEEVSTTDKKLNKWVLLPTTLDLDTLTLEKCLPLFIWPKILGKYKDNDIVLHKMKNIYLKYANKNYNLEQYCKLLTEENKNLPENKKHNIPELENFTKSDCIKAIKYLNKYNKDLKEKRNEKYEFKENKDIIIYNGPYGYYIKYLDCYNIPLLYKWKKDCTGIKYIDCVESIKKFIKKRGLQDKLKNELNALYSTIKE